MLDSHSVETPESIAFAFPVAGIGSRFLAILVDTCLQGLLYSLLFLTYAVLVSTPVWRSLPAELARWGAAILLLALFVVQFGYFIFFEVAFNGQTPGKRLAGLRVVKENGYPLSILDSLIRNLVRIVDFLPLFYGVGVSVMFLNPQAKRLGDFAAGTLVVKAPHRLTLDQVTRPAAALSRALVPAYKPALRRLRETDIALAESFLQRRRELRNAETLAATLAQTLHMRLQDPEAPPPPAGGEIDYLEQLVAAYRQPQP